MTTPFYRRAWRLDADHPCLPGHFPGAPVVPGVLVLEWLARALRDSRGLRLKRISQVKYLHPWRPGRDVELQLGEAGTGFVFELLDQGQVLARGRAEAEP